MSNPNLDQIEKTFDLIDDNFDALYAQCSAAQKPQLMSLRDAARDAFWKAASENLADDHDLVQQTAQELQTVNGQIQQDVSSLQDISAFLNTLTQAVKLAATLATIAAA